MKTNTRTKHSTASIIPDISLMKKMASINGTMLSRILELVDNSIDARINGEQLVINIKIDKRIDDTVITIKDNGCGMTEEQASRFFRLGDSWKANKNKIGRFGLGAKVAILGLGNAEKIKTTPVDEAYEVNIDFDIEKFRDWQIDYTKKVQNKELHGTTIKISDVTVRIGDVKKLEQKLLENIAKTYKHFIEKENVLIKVNGKIAKPQQIDLLDEFYQEFDFEVNGKRVHGWAGAMLKAGTNWKFGFDLINNHRIIKSNDFLSRQAHTSLARLTGEIFLDEFETDIHKTDFIRDREDFQAMQQKLTEEVLDDLIAKVSRLTNKEIMFKYEDKMHQLSKILNKVITNYDFFQNLDLNEEIFGYLKKSKRKKNGEPIMKLAFQATSIKKDDLLKESKKEKSNSKKMKNVGFIVEEPLFISMGQDSGSKRWEVERSDRGLHLKIEINLDHAMYQEESDAETLIKNSVIDSIAEFIVKEEEKYDPEFEDQIERLNTIKDTIVQYTYTY